MNDQPKRRGATIPVTLDHFSAVYERGGILARRILDEEHWVEIEVSDQTYVLIDGKEPALGTFRTFLGHMNVGRFQLYIEARHPHLVRSLPLELSAEGFYDPATGLFSAEGWLLVHLYGAPLDALAQFPIEMRFRSQLETRKYFGLSGRAVNAMFQRFAQLPTDYDRATHLHRILAQIYRV
ncbi:MAG: hypothetical protein O3A46_04695 [Candidatus Poribacteria bacterium]|nr:hypothetical protein [Candidatus Poribacteria bacterium]